MQILKFPTFQKITLVVLTLSMSSSIFATSFPWQGPYAGIFLGGGYGNNHLSSNAGSVSDTSFFTTPVDITAVNQAGTWTQNPNSLIGGFQAGHDWTCKGLLYGVVLDYSWLPLSASKVTTGTYPDSGDSYTVTTSLRTNWLFTLRGRIGYQTMMYLPSLLYITGGMALTQLKVSNHFTDQSAFAGSGGSSLSKNQIGWTEGVGVEVGVWRHLSMNLEYLYMSVPSVTTNANIENTEGGFGIPTGSMGSTFSTKANFHANLFKLGLNYRFDE